ncbi:MAG: NAD(P)-dependent oxidoreductase [Candidatus Latescibacterota bacterium]|nr:NAD(P)-dependent oxidoreductase [Candidatus Latescibacterota bacterium]
MSKIDSLIVVHPRFDTVWPWSADHFHELWREQAGVQFLRMDNGQEATLGAALDAVDAQIYLGSIRRAVILGVEVEVDDLHRLPALREATFGHTQISDAAKSWLDDHEVSVYRQQSEGFWGQSVAECALALTLCALRQIPQLHHRILTDQAPWDYNPPDDHGRPGERGHQFGDDARFTHGTLEGKRVRVVGAGNIGSRYASFCSALGADVAMWDPFSPETPFHRARAYREYHLRKLVEDAEIFAPMLPLTDTTRGIVTADHIDAIPSGSLVVTITRARICDTDALRRRVLADELSLAADVFDVEPLPFDDPLLGRTNVVHTPHIAGRTADANHTWSHMLARQFAPRSL